jgi:hypothetical protein
MQRVTFQPGPQTFLTYNGIPHSNKFMFKKITIIFALICALTLRGMAQSTNSPALTLGKNIEGVHLSITLSNNLINIGSEFFLYAEIENLSTNPIDLVETGAKTDFDILITNSSGKSYNLTPRVRSNTLRLIIKILPFKNEKWSIPVSIGKDISPGPYKLTASREFGLNHKYFDLMSNPLDIQIK